MLCCTDEEFYDYMLGSLYTCSNEQPGHPLVMVSPNLVAPHVGLQALGCEASHFRARAVTERHGNLATSRSTCVARAIELSLRTGTGMESRGECAPDATKRVIPGKSAGCYINTWARHTHTSKHLG